MVYDNYNLFFIINNCKMFLLKEEISVLYELYGLFVL